MITKINDILLNYEVWGEGDPLLILHGWGGSILSTAPIWQFFRNKRKIYVIDFPGQGNESSDPIKPWGIPEYAQLVLSFIREQNITRPDVIAHSFGGRVAIYLAAHEKALFHKMVLADAAGIKPKLSPLKKIKIGMFQCGKWVIKHTTSPSEYEEKLQKWRKRYASPDYIALRNDMMRQTFSKVIHLDLTDQLEKIITPTLLIWGERDEATPLYMAKIMKDRIPNSELITLKNASHFSYLDATTQFNIAVDKFLNNQ